MSRSQKPPQHFDRIAKAIAYLVEQAKMQPSLEAVASHVGMSPHHFQRLFQTWAGVSPKQFSQYLNLTEAKRLLQKGDTSLLQTAYRTGLSSPGRLHDLFVKIEGMTPGEYKQGGKYLTMKYQYTDSPFGNILIASTAKGVSYVGFPQHVSDGLADLRHRFPLVTLKKQTDAHQRRILSIFRKPSGSPSHIHLHLKGTPFQLNVWEALLRIPDGQLSTYGAIAQKIHHPKAVRAVGTAVGDNPIAFLIPCHRVIQSSGVFGNYHWGPSRKLAMIGWERARLSTQKQRPTKPSRRRTKTR